MISADRLSKIWKKVCAVHVDENDKVKIDNGEVFGTVFKGVLKDNRSIIDTNKLEPYRDEIKEMLLQMNEGFASGWTFMQMPFDKDGNQWGEQSNAEQLVILGLALGYVRYTFPEGVWETLPGGVPYITIIFDKLKGVQNEKKD